MIEIRLARDSEVEALCGIERSAAQSFLPIEGLSWIAEDDVQSADRHRELIARGTNWAAVADDGRPVGFLSAEIVERELHIWEISVERQHQGSGIGRALMRHATEEAAAHGLDAVTLTTFRTIPWNGPFYERLGFRTLDEAALSPRLHAILELEAKHGLARDQRCAMLLSLAG